MRRNLVRNAGNEEPGSSADLWNEIRYLDPDLEHIETNSGNSDREAIIAVLFILFLMFFVGWSFHIRGL